MSMDRRRKSGREAQVIYASMRFLNIALVLVKTTILGQEESRPIKEMMGNCSEEALWRAPRPRERLSLVNFKAGSTMQKGNGARWEQNRKEERLFFKKKYS